MEDHKGHRIVKDAFAQLVGVSRYVPGSLYCLDCHEPVMTHEEAQDELQARCL